MSQLIAIILMFLLILPAFAKPLRSHKARHDFMVQTGYPKGRAGYIIDHIVPLACGGDDKPENMQWQTVAETKAKDKLQWCNKIKNIGG